MATLESFRDGFRHRAERQWEERERLRQHTLASVARALREIGRRHTATVLRFFVFGSLTRPGWFTSRSDIDIAVEWRERGDYFGLWREIEEALGREVDFRELGEDSFSERVRQHGIVVYDARSDQNTSS